MNTPKPPVSAGRARSLTPSRTRIAHAQTSAIGTDPGSRSRVIDAPEGTVLATAGSPCEHIYQLVSGEIQIIIPGQADTITANMETARLAQCEGIVDGRWIANVIAETDVRVIKLSPRELAKLLERTHGQAQELNRQYLEASRTFGKVVAELKRRLDNADAVAAKAEGALGQANARIQKLAAGDQASLREVARLCKVLDATEAAGKKISARADKAEGENRDLSRRVADLENQLLILREGSIEGSGQRAEIEGLREELAQRDHLLSALVGGNDRMVCLLNEIEQQNHTILEQKVELAELRAEGPRQTPTVPFELDEDFAEFNANKRRTPVVARNDSEKPIEVQSEWLKPRPTESQPSNLDPASMDWDELGGEPPSFKKQGAQRTLIGIPANDPQGKAPTFDPRTTKNGMPAFKVPRPEPAPPTERKYSLLDAKNRPPKPPPLKRGD